MKLLMPTKQLIMPTKQLISILAIVIALVTLPSCGGDKKNKTEASSTPASQEASMASSETSSEAASETSSAPASSLPASSKSASSKPASSKIASSLSSTDLDALAVNVTPVDRVFYKAKHEQETGVLHGAGQDPIGFRDYTKAVGPSNHPIVYMTYISLTGSVGGINNWGTDLLNKLNALPADVVPQIGLEVTVPKGSSLTTIASGTYDAQIAAFVKAVKNLGRANYVRIGYEFEGSWNNYDATGYVAAFKRITTELRTADTNSATVWCSAGGSAGFMSLTALDTYYPGDEFVDWFGVDIFSPEELTDSRLTAFLAKADKHQKPVMIGETTPRHVGTLDGTVSWEKWFRPFFKLVYENPQIKMICYINWEWDYWAALLKIDWPNWKDGRIEKNAVVNAGMIQELKKPIFVHSTAK
jgi:hypothetical protein